MLLAVLLALAPGQGCNGYNRAGDYAGHTYAPSGYYAAPAYAPSGYYAAPAYAPPRLDFRSSSRAGPLDIGVRLGAGRILPRVMESRTYAYPRSDPFAMRPYAPAGYGNGYPPAGYAYPRSAYSDPPLDCPSCLPPGYPSPG